METMTIECGFCHRSYDVTYQRSFKDWRPKVKFCPFCGKAKTINEAELIENGYERAEMQP